MKSKEIALCGLLCALAVTLLLLGGILGIGTFAGPILAMAVLLPMAWCGAVAPANWAFTDAQHALNGQRHGIHVDVAACPACVAAIARAVNALAARSARFEHGQSGATR